MLEPDAPAAANLFRGALPHIAGWKKGRLEPRSKVIHSSQALCISVFGTIAESADRQQLTDAILASAGVTLAVSGKPTIECEKEGEWELLRERGGRNPTCPDALITWPGQAVLTVESKFTEHLGACSQPRSKQRQNKSERPVKTPACNGVYGPGSDLRPPYVLAPCRLTVAEGRREARRYWELAPRLFREESIRVGQDPCPFKNGCFQLMRNLSFAAALAERAPPADAGFVLAYVAAEPSAKETERTFESFTSMLRDDVRKRVGAITYERIGEILREHGTDETAELAEWLDERLAAVARKKATSSTKRPSP